MALKFHKMHGAGNDFVLLDLRRQEFALDARTAAAIADRHTGVGCDQILVLRSPSNSPALARLEVWNADGSRAEQCGNGVRCVGLYLKLAGEAPEGAFTLEGPVSTLRLEYMDDQQVRVDMGAPGFSPDAVPTSLEGSEGRYTLEIDGAGITLAAVSMGNPHAVIEVEDLDSAPVATLGPAISRHPGFPEGCNVGFAQLIDRHTLKLRVHERGAGETRACGSGACAAAAVFYRQGKLDDRIDVIQAGGTLIIDMSEDAGSIHMTGPAVHVFEGTIR